MFDGDLETVHEAGTKIIALKIPKNYLDIIKEADSKSFNYLQLNINSVFNKMYEVHKILETGKVDAFQIDETKLDQSIPISFFIHKHYTMVRLDRNSDAGGCVLLFLRNKF